MRAPYRLGTADIGELETAARFCGPYIPEPDAESRGSVVIAMVMAALSTLVTIIFFLGVACLTGLACLSVGG